MSLLDSMMTPCKILNRIRTDDEYGGYTDAWTEGATFDATIIKNSTTEAQIAEKQGIEELFTVVTKKSFELDFHDVFRRVSDGQVFRVTSRAIDSEAPSASTVQITKVTAEKWVLPS